jgi:hypothetical protein
MPLDGSPARQRRTGPGSPGARGDEQSSPDPRSACVVVGARSAPSETARTALCLSRASYRLGSVVSDTVLLAAQSESRALPRKRPKSGTPRTLCPQLCSSRKAAVAAAGAQCPAGAPVFSQDCYFADTHRVDPGQDPEAWADAFLDQYRTAPRRDPERDREAADRALRDLPPVTRWMLSQGGREPDLKTIERIQRSCRRQAIFQKWETIFTLVGVALLCAFVLVWSSAF